MSIKRTFVVIKALFCGSSIVSADCPSGPYEILEAGKYGVLVKSEDPKELADGIEAVLCDDAKRKHLAKLSLMRSEAFDQRKIAAQWEALFRDLAQGVVKLLTKEKLLHSGKHYLEIWLKE
jgi:Glycosyltransferase